MVYFLKEAVGNVTSVADLLEKNSFHIALTSLQLILQEKAMKLIFLIVVLS